MCGIAIPENSGDKKYAVFMYLQSLVGLGRKLFTRRETTIKQFTVFSTFNHTTLVDVLFCKT